MLLPGSPFTRESRSTAAPERARVRPPLLRQVMDYDVALTLADRRLTPYTLTCSPTRYVFNTKGQYV